MRFDGHMERSQLVSHLGACVIVSILGVMMPIQAGLCDPITEDSIVITVSWQTVAYSALIGYRACFAATAKPQDALEQLLADMLLSDEAKRYGFTASRFEATPPTERGGLSEREWENFARMRALAREFLTFRLTMQDQVDASPLDSRPDRSPNAPGILSGEASLGERYRRRAADYVHELRMRSDVRINQEWLTQTRWYTEGARRGRDDP